MAVQAFAEELVIGKGATWARSVDSRQPGTKHTGSRPHAPLYFWMTYHGTDAALRYLRDNGALPIRHRWSVAVGGDVDVESPDSTFVEPFEKRLSVPLAIGTKNKEVIERLSVQLAAQDSFTWRTWSKKESVSRGVWRVDVLYDDDTPVQCEVDGERKPCSFRVEVK